MEAARPGDPRAGSDSSEPGEIVAALLHAAVYLRHRLNDFLLQFELSEGRYTVLTELDRAGSRGLSQADLAERLLQSESNISSLIDRLHRDALVDRRWSDTDRRKRVLLLTADGCALIQQVEAARHRWAESLLAALNPNDRQGLSKGLKRLPGNEGDALKKLDAGPTGAAPVPDELWSNHTVIIGRDPSSPRVALERMLSTLGLVGRFAEDMP